MSGGIFYSCELLLTGNSAAGFVPADSVLILPNIVLWFYRE
jgi:hypothetical protein